MKKLEECLFKKTVECITIMVCVFFKILNSKLTVGFKDKASIGPVDGCVRGSFEGSRGSCKIGSVDGMFVGCVVGLLLGDSDRTVLGDKVGSLEGIFVGDFVGLFSFNYISTSSNNPKTLSVEC